ncbi:Uncharacterised protein [Escherichia coli]|nr:Uncharacterised protein [Escherichia coli]
MDLFKRIGKQVGFSTVYKFIRTHSTCQTVQGVGNFLAKVCIRNVVNAFTVGLKDCGYFGRVHLVGYANVIADRGAITHLEVKGVFIRLHLLEGREDIDLGIPASPITTNPHYFANAFVITQFVNFDTNITRLYPITPRQA